MRKTSKRRKIVKVGLGDLVEVGGGWNMVGIVRADEKTGWWMIRGHVSINDCVVSRREIVRVIKKQCVPAKYVRMMQKDWNKD